MEPTPTPDLGSDLAQLRRALDELERGGDEGEAAAALGRAREAAARIDRASKTQRLDAASFSEMAGQINAQGLDIRKVEGYVASLLRGRLGASSIAVLRAGTRDETHPTPDEGVLVSATGPLRRLEVASALAQRLVEIGRPVVLDRESALFPPGSFGPDAALVAPLVLNDAGESVLRGVLVLGPRVTHDPYTTRHVEFLAQLTELIGIALHNAFLHYVATHDALTELYSRGHFDVELKRELSRASRRRGREGQAPPLVSLVLLDLDLFKRVNDTYGHRAGDRVLRLVASTLRRTIRDYDTVARWGGEEFAVVLPDASKRQALDAAERFRKAIRDARVPESEGEALPGITASFGVATFPDDAEDAREIVQKADAALYRSKESGRDRVTGA